MEIVKNGVKEQKLRLGSTGYLVIFAWLLGIVLLAPAGMFLWCAGACLLLSALIFPKAFRRLWHPRWLVLTVLLALPPVFMVGPIDSRWAGIPYSSQGLVTGMQVGVRMVVILVAINGLAGTVDIVSIAGLLERLGLRGLGFSMGVALNLLPSLQGSALNAWHSLRMRGGLRKQRWRGLQLLGMTILANALKRAEEIAIAAEARAYSPEKSRAMPLKKGSWDPLVLGLAVISLAGLLLIR